jgi:hypothetical protein
MKLKLKVPKARNPVAAYATHSGAGVHGKSRKAERRAAKISLREQRTGTQVDKGN